MEAIGINGSFSCLLLLSTKYCRCSFAFYIRLIAERVKCAGKCIPITRGAGVYQEHMNEALDRLSDGAWVFPL